VLGTQEVRSNPPKKTFSLIRDFKTSFFQEQIDLQSLSPEILFDDASMRKRNSHSNFSKRHIKKKLHFKISHRHIFKYHQTHDHFFLLWCQRAENIHTQSVCVYVCVRICVSVCVCFCLISNNPKLATNEQRRMDVCVCVCVCACVCVR